MYVQRRTEKGTKQTRALFVAYFFAALGFFAFGFVAAGFFAAFFGFLAAGFFAAFFGFLAALAFCVVFARLCVEIEVAVSRQHDVFCCVFAADKKKHTDVPLRTFAFGFFGAFLSASPSL